MSGADLKTILKLSSVLASMLNDKVGFLSLLGKFVPPPKMGVELKADICRGLS